jgi:hypothetical protein
MKIAGWVGLALVLGLAGCGQEKDDVRLEQMSCPTVAVAPYARDLVQWRGDGRDLTDLDYRLRVLDVQGSCTRKPSDDNLYVTATVSLDATRGPALAGDGVDATYFVALLRKGEIIQKTTFDLSGKFQPNDDHVTMVDKPMETKLPLSESLAGSDYSLLVGLQLSQTQLDENRAASRR